MHKAFRRHVPVLTEDRELAIDLNAARAFLDEIDAYLQDLG